jgi:hypothetical protein
MLTFNIFWLLRNGRTRIGFRISNLGSSFGHSQFLKGTPCGYEVNLSLWKLKQYRIVFFVSEFEVFVMQDVIEWRVQYSGFYCTL